MAVEAINLGDAVPPEWQGTEQGRSNTPRAGTSVLPQPRSGSPGHQIPSGPALEDTHMASAEDDGLNPRRGIVTPRARPVASEHILRNEAKWSNEMETAVPLE